MVDYRATYMVWPQSWSCMQYTSIHVEHVGMKLYLYNYVHYKGYRMLKEPRIAFSRTCKIGMPAPPPPPMILQKTFFLRKVLWYFWKYSMSPPKFPLRKWFYGPFSKWSPTKMELIKLYFIIITKRQIWCLSQYFQGPEIQWERYVANSSFLPGVNGHFSCFSKWPPPKIQYNI